MRKVADVPAMIPKKTVQFHSACARLLHYAGGQEFGTSMVWTGI